jgi:hypothetical protein
MMGRIAGKSIGELIGEIHNPEVAVYQATEYREKSVEESDVVYECKTSPLKSVNGVVKVPTGPGSGVEIDPEFIRKHQAITD